MKTDNQTAELPGLPSAKKRGRPASGTAKTPAEKQRAYREKQAKEFAEQLRNAYRKGFDDAAAGLAPVWKSASPDQMIAYVCGGMDGAGIKTAD